MNIINLLLVPTSLLIVIAIAVIIFLVSVIQYLIFSANRKHQLFAHEGSRTKFYDGEDKKSGVIVESIGENTVIISSFGIEYTKNRSEIYKI